jgi:hypothetical protein
MEPNVPGVTDRTFTDPFTGDEIDNPTPKSYEVEFSVREFGKEKKVIDTLAESRLTKAQAKQKLSEMAPFMMNKPSDFTIYGVKRID